MCTCAHADSWGCGFPEDGEWWGGAGFISLLSCTVELLLRLGQNPGSDAR